MFMIIITLYFSYHETYTPKQNESGHFSTTTFFLLRVLVSIPFKEELERTTDVGTFSPGVQEQRPQTFPLRIIGNTQVHPETVDPIHG